MPVSCIKTDAEDENSTHDFGRDIIPKLFRDEDVYVDGYNRISGEKTALLAGCGTLAAYWQTHGYFIG